MGLSTQVRTAVATSLLVFSAQVATVNAASASTRYTSTSTVSLMKSSPVSSSAIPGVANSNTPIVLAVVPARAPISRRDTQNKHPKHHDSDKDDHDDDKDDHDDDKHDHDSDKDHDHSDKKHHHSDKEHDHDKEHHHNSDKGHHDKGHHDKGHHHKDKGHDKGYVGAPPADPLSCADATTFYLTDGVINSGGEYLATGRDVLYEPLTASSPRGDSAAGKFAVENGYLRWYDDGFYGGQARYCQMPGSGQVYVTYHVESTWPEGCEEVDLAVRPESWCRDGDGDEYEYKHDDDDDDDDEYKTNDGYKTKHHDDDDDDYDTGYATSTGYSAHSDYETSSSSHYATPTSYETHRSSYKTPTSRATPHSYPTIASAQTPSSQGIYPTYASPTGQLCVETPLSWVLGSHTFIRDEL
ncbi:hypothetical protein F5Y00DRAFT_268772 [Daldinia vernicosa]|uniref:uncharacterized protein n=1 Tax=Daldinia vernicosa TaxID=114800 RepID=UPI0020089C3C|nr:uncharacterized protein F5Y00DRAFT_268772 [Daldinia vernicosa]KAI0850013.1 hypothetical protein F5Y00DRAFT_268772 [Daldinia vernicosa]